MNLPPDFQKVIAEEFYDTHMFVRGQKPVKDKLGAISLVADALIWEGNGNVIPSERKLMEEIFGNWIQGGYYLSAPLEANLVEGLIVKADGITEWLKISGIVKRLTHFECQCEVMDIAEYSGG